MSDSKIIRGTTSRAPSSSESWGGPNWLERAAPKDRARPPAGRHGAITRTLYSYASYKSWADKVRTSWEPPADEPDPKKA